MERFRRLSAIVQLQMNWYSDEIFVRALRLSFQCSTCNKCKGTKYVFVASFISI
jgi:hypothetical protein